MIDTINARSAAPHLSVQSAQAQADAFLQALTDTAAAKGVALVARGSVVAASQFPDWPTKLAEALCADPSLAGQSNQTLAAVIEARSGKTGFNSKLLSKTLSNLQRSYAVGVLERHGYATATLAKFGSPPPRPWRHPRSRSRPPSMQTAYRLMVAPISTVSGRPRLRETRGMTSVSVSLASTHRYKRHWCYAESASGSSAPRTKRRGRWQPPNRHSGVPR
jgi:hypothetical protein